MIRLDENAPTLYQGKLHVWRSEWEVEDNYCGECAKPAKFCGFAEKSTFIGGGWRAVCSQAHTSAILNPNGAKVYPVVVHFDLLEYS